MAVQMLQVISTGRILPFCESSEKYTHRYVCDYGILCVCWMEAYSYFYKASSNHKYYLSFTARNPDPSLFYFVKHNILHGLGHNLLERLFCFTFTFTTRFPRDYFV